MKKIIEKFITVMNELEREFEIYLAIQKYRKVSRKERANEV